MKKKKKKKKIKGEEEKEDGFKHLQILYTAGLHWYKGFGALI